MKYKQADAESALVMIIKDGKVLWGIEYLLEKSCTVELVHERVREHLAEAGEGCSATITWLRKPKVRFKDFIEICNETIEFNELEGE